MPGNRFFYLFMNRVGILSTFAKNNAASAADCGGLHPRLWSYRPFRAATRWLSTASVAMARTALKGRRLQPGVSTPGTQNKKNENSPVGAKEKKHGKFIGKNRHPPRVPCEKHGYSNAERGSSAHFPIYRRCHQGHGRHSHRGGRHRRPYPHIGLAPKNNGIDGFRQKHQSKQQQMDQDTGLLLCTVLLAGRLWGFFRQPVFA